MMCAEAVLVVVLAVGLGALATVLPLAMVSYSLSGAIAPYVPPSLYLAMVGATSPLGAASVLIPALAVSRRRPRSSG